MRTRIAVLLLMGVCLSAAAARGQIVYDQPGSSSLRYYYSNWSIDNGAASASGPRAAKDGLSQGMAALSGFVPLGDNLEARYFLATASNSLELGGIESDLAGIGDLRVQMARSFSRDRLLVALGLNLPTGKQKLDPDGEGRIIGFLSRDYISVPMRRYGEGFGFNLQLGGAGELGRYMCGVSAVFNYTGTYRPYEGSGDYNPGNSISLSATSSAVLAGLSCSGDIGFTYFGKDDLDGRVIYRQAPQLGARLAATYPRGAYSATLGARSILKGRNTRYSFIGGAIDSQLKKYGDELVLFMRLARRAGKDWRLAGLAGTRQIAASEEELGRTSLWNAGCEVERTITGRLDLSLGLLYHAGSTGGGEADIRGFVVSSGLNVTF